MSCETESMWCFWVEANQCSYGFLLFVYICFAVEISIIKRERFGIPLTPLKPCLHDQSFPSKTLSKILMKNFVKVPCLHDQTFWWELVGNAKITYTWLTEEYVALYVCILCTLILRQRLLRLRVRPRRMWSRAWLQRRGTRSCYNTLL